MVRNEKEAALLKHGAPRLQTVLAEAAVEKVSHFFSFSLIAPLPTLSATGAVASHRGEMPVAEIMVGRAGATT